MYILEDLWLGKLDPSGRPIDKGSPYADLREKTNKSADALYHKLSDEGKAAYNAYHDDLMDLETMAQYDSFLSGFRLGVRMLLDALSDDGSPLRKPDRKWAVD